MKNNLKCFSVKVSDILNPKINPNTRLDIAFIKDNKQIKKYDSNNKDITQEIEAVEVLKRAKINTIEAKRIKIRKLKKDIEQLKTDREMPEATLFNGLIEDGYTINCVYETVGYNAEVKEIVLQKEHIHIEVHNLKCDESKPNYEKAYNILMDYWDSLPDEQKEEIHEDLTKCGL